VTATAAATTPTRPAPRSVGRWLTIAVPALLTYVPLLLTAPGVVGADTKTYLYLDPGKVLSEAPYVWSSQIGLGTITHQNIGYLWPMGPFYWLLDAVGLPDWFAQRLWIATIIFAAGMGVRFLCRTLGWATTDRTDAIAGPRRVGPEQWGAVLVASTAYMFSPYLLNYSARISVILLPWAALPWLIGLTARALRQGGWRYPALFALVVLTVGGINATALILIGLGPLLYVVHAIWVDREATVRQAGAAILRIGILTLATSLWWMAGLWAEGRFGLPVIRYTETYRTVATVSSAPEVLRGLGYWFFYGNDKLGPWTEPSATYTTNVAALTLSYTIPIIAMVAAAFVRWRYRALFLTIVVVGALTAIASYPWSNPSLVGSVFKAFTRTDAGLSLRSTPRAVPLVALGFALFLGAGVSALGRRIPTLSIPVAALATLLLFANIPTLWTGQMVAKNLQRPEQIPQYWNDAAAHLQSDGTDTRVVELPGSDFASYRWGNTVDPITPGLMTRGYAARELFQYGSAQSAALLDALDRRLQEGTVDPRAIAPIVRVMGAGDVLSRNDLQYERFRTPRPAALWDTLVHTPGLGPILAFGPTTPNVAGPEQPLIDEVTLGLSRSYTDPPAIGILNVQDKVPIVRTHGAEGTLLMAGDAEGMVDSATFGLIDPTRATFFAASYATDGAGFDRIYGAGADLLVTDSNRKRAVRWGTIREQFGYTERAGEVAPYDPTDQRLEVFPGQTEADQTLSQQLGGATVTATAYGHPVTYTPDDRPANAMDGDPASAWRVGVIDDPIGQRLKIDLAQPVTTDHIQLLQPINLVRNRFITKARLHFDDQPPVDIDLGPESRTVPGQTVTFPTRTFRNLQIEVVETNVAKRPHYDGVSGVGFAEVGIDGVRVDEVIRPPTDLLDRAGASSLEHRLSMVFSRLRSNPAEPVRLDVEPSISRMVSLPTDRRFALSGTARLSDFVADSLIDALVGIPDATQGGITVDSSGHLPGAPTQRGSAALDGDPATYWSGHFNAPSGEWLRTDLGHPTTLDHLDLQLVADGRHSVPTGITIVPDGDATRAVRVTLPAVADGADPGHVAAAPVSFPALTGSTFTFTVTDSRPVLEKDWYSDGEATAPVAIAELGLPGLKVSPPPAAFDSGCRTDLLTLDGTPVPVRITGSTQSALDRLPLALTTCPADTAVPVAAGDHVLRTGTGRQLGIDIDQIAMASDRGGDAMPVAALAAVPPSPGPAIAESNHGPVSYDVRIDHADAPFWLAIGESWSDGWHATIGGHELPAPQVIDGYGNGWLIDPAVYGTGPLTVHVEWTPQKIVWVCIALSLAGLLACLALVIFGRGRRTLAPPADDASRPDRPLHPSLASIRVSGRRASTRLALSGGIAIAAFVALTTPVHGLGLPAMVLAVGGLTAIAFRWRRGRGSLAIAAAASLSVAAMYTIVSQYRHRYAADFIWPAQFAKVSLFGLAAVFLLLGEAARDLLVPDVPTEPAPPTPQVRSGAPEVDDVGQR
jgi:arabinofuranan 3-O-arabinosyltransferase